MKDWHLLLLSVGIVMIEVVYTIPLLILEYVTGDTRLETDDENPSFINASELLKAEIFLCYMNPRFKHHGTNRIVSCDVTHQKFTRRWPF